MSADAKAAEPESIADALRPMLEQFEAERAAVEAHQRTCTARPCERCTRFVCKCGAPVDGATVCSACAEAKRIELALRPTVASLPAADHFRRTFDADASDVAKYVVAPSGLVQREMLQPQTGSSLFLGPTSAGKTTLSVAMLGRLVRSNVDRWRGSLFVPARKLAVARSQHRIGEGEAPLVRNAIEAPLLVLDDLPQEADDKGRTVPYVIVERSDAGRPTWLTCGLMGDGLKSFAELLHRRYADGGVVTRILARSRRVHLGTGATW